MHIAKQLVRPAIGMSLVLFFSGVVASQSVIWNDIETSAPWLLNSQPYSVEQWEKTEGIVTDLVSRHYQTGSFSDTEIARLMDEFSGKNLQADWVWFNAFELFFTHDGVDGDKKFQGIATRFKTRLVGSLKSDRAKAIRFYQLFALTNLWAEGPVRVSPIALLSNVDKLKRRYSGRNAPAKTLGEKSRLSYDALQLFLVMVVFEKNDEFPEMERLTQEPGIVGEISGDLGDWFSKNWFNLCLRQNQKTYRTTLISGNVLLAIAMCSAAIESASKSGSLEAFDVYLMDTLRQNKLFVWRKDELFFPRPKLPEMDVESLGKIRGVMVKEKKI